MAWTAPMTAVSNTAFTAAQFNTHVRDNLLETAPAKATSGFSNGSIPVKSGTNQITFRTPQQQQILTEQSTSSTSYTNLTSTGPTVTVTTGSMAFVSWHCSLRNNSTNSSYMSVGVTGATTDAANDDRSIRHRDGTGSSGEEMMGIGFLFTSLNPGTNTFQAKYRVIGGTGTFRNRRISVIPL